MQNRKRQIDDTISLPPPSAPKRHQADNPAPKSHKRHANSIRLSKPPQEKYHRTAKTHVLFSFLNTALSPDGKSDSVRLIDKSDTPHALSERKKYVSNYSPQAIQFINDLTRSKEKARKEKEWAKKQKKIALTGGVDSEDERYTSEELEALSEQDASGEASESEKRFAKPSLEKEKKPWIKPAKKSSLKQPKKTSVQKRLEGVLSIAILRSLQTDSDSEQENSNAENEEHPFFFSITDDSAEKKEASLNSSGSSSPDYSDETEYESHDSKDGHHRFHKDTDSTNQSQGSPSSGVIQCADDNTPCSVESDCHPISEQEIEDSFRTLSIQRPTAPAPWDRSDSESENGEVSANILCAKFSRLFTSTSDLPDSIKKPIATQLVAHSIAVSANN